MIKIGLHKIDKPEAVAMLYNLEKDNYDDYISDCRKRLSSFHFTYKISLELLQIAVAKKPALSLQKKWFNYGLNCISEFCRLAHFPNQEKEAQIDRTGNFVIKVERLNELTAIEKPIQLARIARDEEKEKAIASFPADFLDLDRNITFGHIYANTLTKLEIEYSLTGNFNKEYFASLVEVYQKNSSNIQSKISPDTSFILYYLHPYVLAFNSLAENDEPKFNENLIKALEAHKEVWGQKKAMNRGGTPLCRENEGFLSLECTALAAMAYDKGWKLEVESDYMPSFMVDGSIND